MSASKPNNGRTSAWGARPAYGTEDLSFGAAENGIPCSRVLSRAPENGVFRCLDRKEITVSVKLTIPPELVQPLRDRLLAELPDPPGETSTRVKLRPRRPSVRAEGDADFDRMEAIRRLLDAIRWYEPKSKGSPPVKVDVRKHHGPLLRALQAQVESDSGVATDPRASEVARSAARALAGPLTAFVQQVEECVAR